MADFDRDNARRRCLLDRNHFAKYHMTRPLYLHRLVHLQLETRFKTRMPPGNFHYPARGRAFFRAAESDYGDRLTGLESDLHGTYGYGSERNLND